MSFTWDAVDERERNKHEKEVALRDYLLMQQEESRSRKLKDKQMSIEEWQKMMNSMKESTERTNRERQINQLTAPRAPINENTTRNFNSLFGGQVFSEKSSFAVPPPRKPNYVSNIPVSNPQQLESIDISQNSTIPFLNLSNMNNLTSLTTDIQSKLRYAEDQLANEQRTRGYLESELQHTKSALSQIQTQIVQLQAHQTETSTTLRDLHNQINSQNECLHEAQTTTTNRLERDALHHLSQTQDLMTRTRHLESKSEESNDRARGITENVSNLHVKLDGISVSLDSLSNDARGRVKDLEFETSRLSESLRVLKDHDKVLDAIQLRLDGGLDVLGKRIEAVVAETRIRSDTDSRARTVFETGVREMYQEVRKAMVSQDRELGERVDAVRQSVVVIAERERGEREKSIAAVLDFVRGLEKSAKECEVRLVDRMTKEIAIVQGGVVEDRAGRGKFETAMRAEWEEGFKLINAVVNKKGEDLQNQQNELKQCLALAARSLQESLILVEKTSDSKLASVEDVLRAEVKARMNTDTRLSDMDDDFTQQREALHKVLLEQINEVASNLEVAVSKLEEDLKKTSDQLSVAKTRSVDDLETQLTQLRKRIKEAEAMQNDKFKAVHSSIELTQQLAQDNLEESEIKLETQISNVRADIEVTMEKVKRVEIAAHNHSLEVDEKLNGRQLQMDQSMEALKEEIAIRCTQQDLTNFDAHLKATVHSVHTSVSHLQSSLSSLKEDVEYRATRKELTDVDNRMQTIINTLHAKAISLDDNIIQVREDIALRATKKEAEELDSRFKSAVLKLQTRDIELEDILSTVRDEISDRVLKKQLLESEEQVRDRMNHLEGLAVSLQVKSDDLDELLTHRATKLDVEALSNSIVAFSENIQIQLRDTKELIELAKEEVSKATQDDMNDMATGIKAAVNTLEARTSHFEEIVEGVKIKISDNDMALRNRMKDLLQSQDIKIAEHNSSIDITRTLFHDEIRLINARLDDMPRSITQAEHNYNDFKRWITDSLNESNNKTMSWLTEIRESLQTKPSADEFERLETEHSTNLMKLQGKLELESQNLDILRSRLTEIDLAHKDRHRDLATAQAKNLEEHLSTIRQLRDSTFSNIDEIRRSLDGYPKLFDSTKFEIRKLRMDLDGQITGQLQKIDREMNSVRNELASKPSERNVDEWIHTTINPLASRIDRLASTIEELRVIRSGYNGGYTTQPGQGFQATSMIGGHMRDSQILSVQNARHFSANQEIQIVDANLKRPIGSIEIQNVETGGKPNNDINAQQKKNEWQGISDSEKSAIQHSRLIQDQQQPNSQFPDIRTQRNFYKPVPIDLGASRSMQGNENIQGNRLDLSEEKFLNQVAMREFNEQGLKNQNFVEQSNYQPPLGSLQQVNRSVDGKEASTGQNHNLQLNQEKLVSNKLQTYIKSKKEDDNTARLGKISDQMSNQIQDTNDMYGSQNFLNDEINQQCSEKRNHSYEYRNRNTDVSDNQPQIEKGNFSSPINNGSLRNIKKLVEERKNISTKDINRTQFEFSASQNQELQKTNNKEISNLQAQITSVNSLEILNSPQQLLLSSVAPSQASMFAINNNRNSKPKKNDKREEIRKESEISVTNSSSSSFVSKRNSLRDLTRKHSSSIRESNFDMSDVQAPDIYERLADMATTGSRTSGSKATSFVSS
ncbi:hypothetical protein HK096_007671 [Nowakowskiella sp. JEL0078]|nr:hypothetical protein HK096_007671 [Nowakowskiella sp. JEL0078]